MNVSKGDLGNVAVLKDGREGRIRAISRAKRGGPVTTVHVELTGSKRTILAKPTDLDGIKWCGIFRVDSPIMQQP
jgi:hypothetical protein